jgi:hypothetical protein
MHEREGESSIFELQKLHFPDSWCSEASSCLFTWLPAQKIIEMRHDTSEIPRPDMKSDFRSRLRYLVYKSSSCEFSAMKHRERNSDEGRSSLINLIDDVEWRVFIVSIVIVAAFDPLAGLTWLQLARDRGKYWNFNSTELLKSKHNWLAYERKEGRQRRVERRQRRRKKLGIEMKNEFFMTENFFRALLSSD